MKKKISILNSPIPINVLNLLFTHHVLVSPTQKNGSIIVGELKLKKYNPLLYSTAQLSQSILFNHAKNLISFLKNDKFRAQLFGDSYDVVKLPLTSAISGLINFKVKSTAIFKDKNGDTWKLVLVKKYSRNESIDFFKQFGKS